MADSRENDTLAAETVEKACGEYHALVFRLCDAARAAGDEHAAAVAAYLHDQFCVTRAAMRGETCDTFGHAPYPTFRSKGGGVMPKDVTITKDAASQIAGTLRQLGPHPLGKQTQALADALDEAQAAHIEGGEDNTVTIVVVADE